jgi:hypothetical protein
MKTAMNRQELAERKLNEIKDLECQLQDAMTEFGVLVPEVDSPSNARRLAVIGLKSIFLCLSVVGMPMLVFWALNALGFVVVDFTVSSMIAFWILLLTLRVAVYPTYPGRSS